MLALLWLPGSRGFKVKSVAAPGGLGHACLEEAPQAARGCCLRLGSFSGRFPEAVRLLAAGSLAIRHRDFSRPFRPWPTWNPVSVPLSIPSPYHQPRCGPGQSSSAKPSLPSTPFSQNKLEARWEQ